MSASPRLRANVFVRLLCVLALVAALPTAVLMLVQERALVRDLEEAAAGRLDRARHAAERLLDGHVSQLAARYRAVSGTPQFRATLEIGDAATLRFYAGELASREGATSIAFVTPHNEFVGGGDEPGLARQAWESEAGAVFERDGGLYTLTEVMLRNGAERVGALLVVERVGAARLEEWSDVCGATLAFERASSPSHDRLVRSVRRFGDFHLTVTTSLQAERRALAHARRNLAASGALALTVALLASVFLSRNWVRPIVGMRHAAERIGGGDFDARVASRRNDEIGDVARAFDDMAERLGDQQAALETKVCELRDSRERLSNAQRMARMGSWRFQLDTGRVEASEELREILGLGPAEDFDLKDFVALLHPDDAATVIEATHLCVQERSSLHVDHRVVLPDGSERVLQTQARFVDADSMILEGSAQDVTERRRTEEQIRFLAYHDGLTGLGNRRLFQERLDIAIVESRRLGLSCGVLFLDLDHFKRINDTLGHSVGDRLLQGVADRLVKCVREADLVSRAELPTAVSRFGGDEFTLLIGQVTEVRDLAKVARRLLESLIRPFTLEGHEIVITGSVGIAAWPGDGDDSEILMRNADAAMYHAKEQGRNNYQFYTAAMNEEALQRLILESRLRRALEQDEFEVHYQPKLDGSGRRVVGLEALARWRDPELGVVLPGEFIPIAEETGLIGALGDCVLRTSCADRRRWCDAGLPAVPVSVNLSAHQFRNGSLAARVSQILDETGLDPRLLELEITESTLLHDEAVVVEALGLLRKRGVRVAVDDFGTGYSSFAYLGRLPVDALKIDRSFVRGIAEHPGEAALTAAIVAMGHALGLSVVAEGVETEQQRALLADWNCDELQGFLFAHPMPDATLMEWWRRRS